MKYLLAGTYQQAVACARELKLSQHEWRYLSGPADLLGIRNPDVVVYGTPWQRSDYHMLKQEIAARTTP